MPKKLTTKQVKDLFSKYGYIVPDGFVYRNNKQKIRVYDEMNETYENMNVQQLKYRTARAATIRQPYFDPNIMNININVDVDVRSNDSFDRWCAQRNEEFNDLDDEYKRSAFDYYRQVMPIIARKQNTTLHFDQENDNQIPKMYGLVEALRTVDFSQYDVRLGIRDVNNMLTFAHANENTINFLFNSFFDVQDAGDSSDAMLNNFIDMTELTIDFIPRNQGQQRTAPGFFPFVNKDPTISLSRYGVYSDESSIVNESCLITAIKSSGLLTEEEMKLLRSMIKTRYVLKSMLKKIARTFKIFIYVQIITDYSTGKTSHEEFGEKTDRKLKLLIMYDHFMLNETMMYKGKRLGLFKIIKSLMDENKLVPLSEETKKRLILNYVNENRTDNDVDCSLCYRPIKIKDVKLNKYINEHRVNQGKRFFGYVPENDEVQMRLQELQDAINTLPLRKDINVRDYYRFSDLAQKILYETGCYDSVYELTGKRANEIRETLKFPKTKITNGKKTLYLTGKYYYLDLNAAYMNFIRSIPSGLDDDFSNDTVGVIIKMLYDLRVKAKRNGNDKLAKTLKFIMNSSWGYSIKRPKNIRHKYVHNVDNYIKRFSPFVLKQKGNYVESIECYVENFTFPQFAKSVLDEYNKFFDKVKDEITVYYENIDAILTDEEGFNKLKIMGLIDEEKMGSFKVDKVFTEFAAISNKRYVARTIDDNIIYHCINNLSYDEVVMIAKNE